MALLGYRLSLVLACVLGGWVAYKAWRNRETTGARPLAAVALASVLWAGGSLGLTLTTTPAAEFRWIQLMYIGIVGAPISFIVLALKYTGHRRYLTPTTVGSLCVGGVFLALAWTNPYHHWYWAKMDYTAAVPAGAASTPAPGFWGFVVFTYLLLLVGTVLLVRYALTAPHLYRSQTIAILVGVSAPWAANIPHSLQLMAADYTPVALAVTTGTLWVAMFRYRLTEVGPVALRTVFESISTGVFVLDRHDRLVDVNAAGRALLDVPEDAIGTPFRDLVPTAAFAEHVRTPTDQRDVIAVEADQSPARDAPSPRHYEVQVTPINASHEGQAARIVVVNDVTEQQRRQQQLERQNERLEAFTSVVSHDLRNPLNVAAGNVTLARENGDGDHLERADRALTRMETLIDDLLTLAYGGEQVSDPEPVALHDVVTDAWQTVDTQDATLVNRASTTFLADRSRLRQLIENLLRNAIEHGGDTVTVTVEDGPEGFSVADDGTGLPADDRGTIFDTGYSTREHGTGLGLNIVRKIVDAHGWTVHATDSAEGGARFEVTGVDRPD